jgi:hypothetical protein
VAVLSRKFFGSAATEGAAFAFGAATAPVLSPALESVRQQAWKLHSVRIPETAELAAAVAQEKLDLAQAEEWAARNGFSPDVFGTLVTIARTAPDVGTAMQAWRRGEIDSGGFNLVLARHGIDGQWWQALQALKLQLLSPGELAAAIHRGLVPDPGLLKGEQPTGPFKVEAYPVYDIPTLDEAAGSGFDRDRLGVLVGLQGLPMGTHEAAQAYFRGIITHGDYIRAFNESNSRNEWAEAVLGYARQIPTARDFIENALRGYRTFAEAADGAALHGMSEEHARLIFQNSGRPLNLHQITQAEAWGGKYDPQPGDDPDPYTNAVLIGAVTPAYYDLQEKLKYNLPSGFYFRTLQQTGVLTEAEAATWYRRLGWPPELADKIANAYAKPAATSEDSHLGKARTQLWGTTHRSYIAREISDTQARNRLAEIGVPTGDQAGILNLWGAERDLIRKQLTPAQIKKGLAKQSRNAATGQPWTRDEALAALIERGYSATDANTYLDIP